jgi:CheY-like chemotaxis protein
LGHILIADDDEDYALLMQIALTHAGFRNPVRIVSNGLEVIQYLEGDGPYADRAIYPMPSLVLLDLRLPVRHGLEVLRWIRRQPRLRSLRVAVLSGSELESEAQAARESGANSFLFKPVRFQTLVQMFKQHRASWLPKPAQTVSTRKTLSHVALLVDATEAQPHSSRPAMPSTARKLS